MTKISLNELKNAIKSLGDALNLPKNDITRDASIQRFEFCIELSWKSSRKIMGTATTAPKQIIREMAQNDLIADLDLWLEAIDHRNLSSHTYNEDLANKVYDFIKIFSVQFTNLLNQLEKKS